MEIFKNLFGYSTTQSNDINSNDKEDHEQQVTNSMSQSAHNNNKSDKKTSANNTSLFMNKNIHIAILAICEILFFISCTRNSNVTTITQFPKVEELNHEIIPTPNVLYTPTGLLLLDSAVIVQDLKSDTIFQVFKFPSFAYAGGFVKRGGGPDEEIFVDPFM